MPRAKRKYIVATDVTECDTEKAAIEAYKALVEENAKQPITLYSVTGAQELRPVMRLEKANATDTN